LIVGAGIAGLSAAWRLKRSGFDRFVLLELEGAAGGTSRFGTEGVVAHPWGAHYLPAPMKDNPPLVDLLREMGVVEGTNDQGDPIYAEHVLCRDPQERLFAFGQWHEGLYLADGASLEDRRQQQAFFAEIDRWVALRDAKGRRPFSLPLANRCDDPLVTALDRLSMAEWLDRQGFTSPRLRWLVDYGCRDDYGAKPEDVSAWAGLFYFASRRASPGAEPQPLLTWPEGNGRLVRHLAQAGAPQLGEMVIDVNPVQQEGRSLVEVLVFNAKQERVVGYRAEQVIFCAPQFVARHALRPWRENPPAHLHDFEYGAWMVANLHLDSRPVEGPVGLAWDNVLYDSPSLGYVVATHQAHRDFGPTVFTYYYPLTQSDTRTARGQLMQLDRDPWAELSLADLERAHPDLRRRVSRIDVMRWGHAMIRPKVGFVHGASRRAAQKEFRGIRFAHSDLSGLALFEEAFYHGCRAAEDVLSERNDRGMS
jgi:protoporphyrinogen oxidase